MKSILLSAAAIASVISAPAFAKTGGDGVGTYQIRGSADAFCQLGQINGNSEGNGSRNVTIDYTTPIEGTNYNGGTSDAMINITQLQNENNDHAKAWRAVINMRRSVCNTAYTVTANSANGGLQYQGTENGGSDFAKKLAYTVQANFDDRTGNPKTAQNLHNGGATLLRSNRATAGDFKLIFDGDADNSQYLLAGDYTDTVTVYLTANTGTAGGEG